MNSQAAAVAHLADTPVPAFDELQSFDDYVLSDEFVMLEFMEKSNVTAGGIILPDSVVDMVGRYFPIIHTGTGAKDLKGKIAQSVNLGGVRDMFTIRNRRYMLLHRGSIQAYTTPESLGIKL